MASCSARITAGYTEVLEDLGWKVVARTPREVLLHWPGPPRPVARAMTKVEWVKDASQIAVRIQQRGNEACTPILLATERDRAGKTTALQPVAISSIEESRLGVRCRVENPSMRCRGGVIFSRAWYPGYCASLDGKPLEVHVVNGLQPAVLLPPGAKGELLLRFAPSSVRYGLMIALFGSVLAIVGPWWSQAHKRRLLAQTMRHKRRQKR